MHLAVTCCLKSARQNSLFGNACQFGLPFFLLLVFCSSLCTLALPDMQNVSKPNPEPTLLAAFDTFIAPVDSTTPPASAPAFAEWTRSGGPDDTLIATGSNFSSFSGSEVGRDAKFLSYGQTSSSNGCFVESALQRLDGMKAAITLGAGLPAWSTYFLWASNNTGGSGYPIAINRTQAWWLGPKKAIAGATISVFGRNLAHDNGATTSYIYVKPAGSAGQWATVTSVNPYKVSFTVPNLANGVYEVWVHNGHGEHYGWAGPLSLTVYSGPGWTSTDFNVINYGATGNGVTDDTSAIRSAISDASRAPYSSVYFPAGTYMVSDSLTPSSNMRLRGAGKNSTFIKCLSTYNANSWGLLFNNGNGNPTNIEIRDLTLDCNGNYRGNIGNAVYFRFVTDLWFTNIAVKAKGYAVFDLNGSNNVYLTNCDITGKESFLGGGSQCFISGCNYYNTNDAQSMIFSWGRTELSMTNSTGQDENNTLADGWGQGRFFTGNGIWGTSRNVYLGDNTTTDLTVRPECPEQNTGEQFMFEGNNTQYQGTATAASSNTVTFSDLATDYTNQEAIIVKGTGLGQHRQITGWNSGSKTITVSPAWNLAPDTSSTVIIEYALTNYAIYHNMLDAKDYAATNVAHNASSGVEPFGGCDDFLVDNNTFNQLRCGTSTWALGQTNPTEFQPCFFNIYCNNRYQSNRWATIYTFDYYGNAGVDPGVALLDTVYRNNTISNPLLAAFAATKGGSWTSNGLPMDVTVYEHNTVTNVPIAFDIAAAQSVNPILYKNSLTRGSAAFSGSVGANLSFDQHPALRQNSWSGFETTYPSSQPPPSPDAPMLWVKAEVGVTKDGSNNVASWADQSGNNNNLTPDYTGNKPLYVAAGVNNLPVIRFNGVNQNLYKMLKATLPGTFTIFTVCAAPNAQADQSQAGVNNRVLSCPTTTNADYEKGFQITAETGSAFAPTLKIYSKTLDSGQYINIFGLGAMFLSNGNIGASFHFTGDIAEVIIYNRTLTAQETSDMTTYLKGKYNLQ